MAENSTVAMRHRRVGAGPHGDGLGLFVKRWASNPRRIGAILPSAKTLARIMARESVQARCGRGPVVELGPGTGSITRALLENGIAEEELVLVERDRELCQWLEHRFPRAVVVEGEAANLRPMLDERSVDTPSVVVSSLPLRNMAEGERDAIIQVSLDGLPHSGSIVQFTYARHPAIACERLEVECQRVGFVPLNVPPAGVWRIRRLHGRAVRRRSEADVAQERIRRPGHVRRKCRNASVAVAFSRDRGEPERGS